MDDDGHKRINSYFSATLNDTEKRYHINEAEALAVVRGIQKYAGYLSGKPFTLVTDNRALLWLNKNRDAKTKLGRWSLLLQEYDFDIIHVPGKENQLADFLSRNPEPSAPDQKPIALERMVLPELKTEPQQITYLGNARLYRKVVRAQKRSRRIAADKLRWLDIRANGPETFKEQKFYQSHVVEDDLLWRRCEDGDKLILPTKYLEAVIVLHHDTPEAGHPGAEETIRSIERYYSHKHLHKSVRNYVKNCIICASVKSNIPQRHAPLKPRTPNQPFEVISIDTLGPYDEQSSGNRYLLIVEDLFTKWVEAVPVKEADHRAICDFLNKLFSRFGIPRTIISDNGPSFESNQYLNFCQKFGIEAYKVPIYHQRANSVERRVQEFKKTIRTLMYKTNDKTKWEDYIDKALVIMRCRKNRATGMTPSKALYGYEIPKRGDWNVLTYQKERDASKLRQRDRRRIIRTRQLNFNRKNFPQNPLPQRTFSVDDLVMVKEMRQSHGGFYPKWTGPHRVVAKESNEVYEVDREGGYVRVHIDKIRPAPRGNALISDSSDFSDDVVCSSEGESSESTPEASATQASRPNSPEETIHSEPDRHSASASTKEDNLGAP